MTDNPPKQGDINKRANQIFLSIAAGWTVLIVGLCILTYNHHFQTAVDVALNSSMNSFEKDVVYRKWAAIHGGVYVPISEYSPPNPYLTHVPNRDVETTFGLKLTLVNPAYMTRQVHELGLKEYGLRGHITSLNPLRPENAPDQWEKTALEGFNQGKTETWSIEKIDDKTYLRFMRPFVVEESCLKCHAHQGYKIGDVRGGISTSIPWDKAESSIRGHSAQSAGLYAVVWLVGIAGIFVSHRALNSRVNKHQADVEALRKSDSTLKTITGNVPVGIGLAKDRVMQWANEAFFQMTGYSRDEVSGLSSRRLYRTEEEFERVGKELHSQIKISGQSEVETCFVRKDGTPFDALLRLASIDKHDLSSTSVFIIMDISDKRRAAQELKENSERLQRAELAAKFGNWELDLNSGKMRGSKGAIAIYGLEQQELEQAEVQKIPLPEYRAMMDEALEALIKRREPYDLEFRAVRQSDKKIIDIHSIADFNEVTNIIWGVIQDVTEQKEAEEALRKSEARYRFLTENVADVIWQMSPDLSFTYMSPSVTKQLGYDVDEVIGKNILDLLAPESREMASSVFGQRMKWLKENSFLNGHTYELQFVRKDGVILWIEVTSNPAFNEEGNLVGFQGVARDISDRKRAEELLRESESLFRSYVESAPLGIWETDGIGRIVSANRATSEITGYSHEQLLGMNMFDFCLSEELPQIYEQFKRLIRTESESAEVRVKRADGAIIWESVNAVKLSEDRYLFFIQDITEKKHVQEEIIEMERRLFQAQKLESLGVLSGGIAHDFNNLLAVIIGNLELAADKIDPASGAILNIDKAMNAAERSALLTRQMLSYSGKSVQDITEINLTDVIRRQEEMLRAAVVKTANLEFALDDEIPNMRGDFGEIQQVALNLVTNASESLESGYGTVRVSTGVRYCDHVMLSRSLFPEKPQPQNMVFLEVYDDGVGMENGAVDRLFDPFYTTKFLGRGLGMSVVHGVVKGHRGAITVDTDPGTGTTVRVYFPVSESVDVRESASATLEMSPGLELEPKPGGLSGTALVVDDEPLVSDFLVSALEKFGLGTIKAFNGKQAVQLFKQASDSINLVLLDLSMPEMDGVATFDELKKIKPDVRIILCSGYSEEEMLGRFDTDKRPDAFLKKPAKLSDLRNLVQIVLPG